MRQRLKEEEVEEIVCKFLINLRKGQHSLVRIWLHFEKAYYYYLDQMYHMPEIDNTNGKNKQIFELYQILNNKLPKAIKCSDKVLREIKQMAQYVPITGTIVISRDFQHTLLVETRGREVFGFPKGKVDQGEETIDCAQRELLQETGLRIKLNQEDKFYFFTKKACTFYYCVVNKEAVNIKAMNKKFNHKDTFDHEIQAICWRSISELMSSYYQEFNIVSQRVWQQFFEINPESNGDNPELSEFDEFKINTYRKQNYLIHKYISKEDFY